MTGSVDQNVEGDIGVIGLAVMGQNLILNMNDHGFKVVAYNRSASKVDAFLEGPANGTNIVGASSIEHLVAQLKAPRKIMLMVRAGDVVDQVIAQLVPYLSAGDIIIDGGNSNYDDSSRRLDALKKKDILFVGTGVSGGEEGARNGPSIMPGGSAEAWPHVQSLFQSIAAKTPSGEPCCDWVGAGGAGHYVKMVHNGIEYGDMQLIAEAYHFMSEALQMDHQPMSAVFSQWNETELNSYLVEITSEILAYKESNGTFLLSKILDKAGQKGTGKWTGINALDLGVPLTLITESVFARCVSSLKEERVAASGLFAKPDIKLNDQPAWLADLRQALLASKIISYAQGFMLMRAASEEFDWSLNYGNVALLWREGCIIRSAFLENIRDAFDRDPNIAFLGLDPYFQNILESCLPAWRRVVSKSFELGIPMPCMATGLNFLDAYTSERLPANLIQAQRDYFGAHTYQRIDDASGAHHHTDWTGQGGGVSSTNYDV